MPFNAIVPLSVLEPDKPSLSQYLCENYIGVTAYHPLRPFKEIIEQAYGLEPYTLETTEGKLMKPQETHNGTSFKLSLQDLLKRSYPEIADTLALWDYIRTHSKLAPHDFPTFADYLSHCFLITENYQSRLRHYGAKDPVWVAARWLKDYLNTVQQGTVVIPGIRHPDEAKAIIDLSSKKVANVVVIDTHKRGKESTSDKYLPTIKDMFQCVDYHFLT